MPSAEALMVCAFIDCGGFTISIISNGIDGVVSSNEHHFISFGVFSYIILTERFSGFGNCSLIFFLIIMTVMGSL
jgi:hypothetical protein